MSKKTLRIAVTGGGTGGHITPALVVAEQVKKLRPKSEITYIGLSGDMLNDVPSQHKSIDKVVTVRAGKFRRYHGEGLKQLLDIRTLFLNIRDSVFIVMGLWQSFWLLKRLKPDVIFTRGSYVSVPVCWAAALLKIPYITHDSDAIPSLANRLIAPWARLHAVALPKKVYSYPPVLTVTVGVPISHQFAPLAPADMARFRRQLGLDHFKKVVFVTGGGTGAARVNNAVFISAPELLARYPNLAIVHLTGRAHEADIRKRYKQELPKQDSHRVIVKGFVTNLHMYSGAADVVVTRAGATSIAEFAAQAKPCVVIPNPFLTGGHQLKNAQVLQDRKAVRMVNESLLGEDPKALLPPLVDLLDHPELSRALGLKLAKLAHRDAAHKLAGILLSIADGESINSAKSDV